ncbi:beta-ketoacyl reductase [Nocardia sp. CDC159]|uniref:Beta-ketoacyl reductase n=1 Tax=Nocardia pulmonis TaxID=2951408 RepID=A0A9X2IY44_9NOCA|nr:MULTISPECIES: beta-ketoacyl reductase [Nocardia]MCM6774565.1 beta-ketoacyl reductase [Nocardia pulmonis]MCM6787370.1 beta-ketoacyl reductase [Nocardia sp. CDC159]
MTHEPDPGLLRLAFEATAPPRTLRRERTWQVRGAATARVAALRSALAPADEPEGVVYLAPPPTVDLEAQRIGLAGLFEIIAAALARATVPALTVATFGARPGSGASDPVTAAYLGIVRVLGRDHPELRARLVDLDSGDPDWVAALVGELDADDDEDLVLIRQGVRFTGRWHRHRLGVAEPLELPGAGTYLVAVPDSLAQRAVAALTARGAPNPVVLTNTPDRAGAARPDGRIVAADPADRAGLERALTGIRRELPPIRGVVYAPASPPEPTLRSPEARDLAAALVSVRRAVVNLDELTRADDIDLFVLLGSPDSMTATAGAVAIDSCLDRLAADRAAAGPTAVSMPSALVGSGPGFDAALRCGEPVIGCRGVDIRQWFDTYPATAALGSFRRLRTRPQAPGPVASDLPRVLAELPTRERTALILNKIRELAADVLGLSPESIDDETPLEQLGMDSMQGLRLRGQLERLVGMRLAVTLLWTYGSPRALAEALDLRLRERTDPVPRRVP